MPYNAQGAAQQAPIPSQPAQSSNVSQLHKKRKPSVGSSSSPSGEASCKSKQPISSLSLPTPQNSTSDKPANPAKRIKSGESTPSVIPAASAGVNSTDEMLASSPQGPRNNNNVVDLTKNSPSKGRKPLYSQPSGLTPRNGAKKILIKNRKETSSENLEGWVQKTLDLLDGALTAVFEDKDRTASKEEVYQGCQNLCRLKREPLIHDLLKRRCSEHVSGALRESILNQPTQSDEELVRIVEAAWNKWQNRLSLIQELFFFLNQAYLYTPTGDREQILDMGYNLFSSHIITDSKFRPRFLNGVFCLYERDRKGHIDVANTSLLLASVRILSRLGLYSSLFEPRFIDVSEGYYRLLAEEIAELEDVAKYARECASQIKKEITRVEKFNLETTTKRDLIKIIEKEMILHHMVDLTDRSGIEELIKNNDVEALGILYTVINRVDNAGLKIRPIWAKYIKERGTAVVVDQEHEPEMIPRLLELKKLLEIILRTSFNKNEELGHALRESFETFINEQRKGVGYKNNSKPSEMIAKHMDLLLRTGIKAISSTTTGDGDVAMGMGDEDVQLSYQLDQALDLFRFIHGKDVFEAFYKKDLARRLLLGRSASADAEKAMLSKLKTECGSGFTMNLEIMFKDIDISKENMNSFKVSKAAHQKAGDMDLHVTVLSQAAWPTYPETTITMPQNVAEYMEAYHQYYTSKHKGRKLAWRHALAHCVLKANFPKGKKELSMSAFQAVVLLLFSSDTKPLSYEYIKTATSLPDAELIRTLQSLACAKIRPLTKHPKGKDVNPTDTFTVNLGFTDPKFRIKINQIQLKETKEDNNATHEQVTQDRQYETQAAIIRIMKSRKTVGHNELITETINQTKKRGVLDMADIKKNIERLIDKDYMERSENNSYTYVA